MKFFSIIKDCCMMARKRWYYRKWKWDDNDLSSSKKIIINSRVISTVVNIIALQWSSAISSGDFQISLSDKLAWNLILKNLSYTAQRSRVISAGCHHAFHPLTHITHESTSKGWWCSLTLFFPSQFPEVIKIFYHNNIPATHTHTRFKATKIENRIMMKQKILDKKEIQ